jgi:hypothetical protein
VIFAFGHYHVICSDPDHLGNTVAFNFTDKNFENDQTCIVHVGDHPTVTKESVIAYRYGLRVTPAHIERLTRLGATGYNPVSPDLLLRIQKGALESKRTTPDLKKIIETALKPVAA